MKNKIIIFSLKSTCSLYTPTVYVFVKKTNLCIKVENTLERNVVVHFVTQVDITFDYKNYECLATLL